MATGTIKFYDKKKAYGFIISPDHQKEVYFHITSLKDRNYLPDKDDEVQFDVKPSSKGVMASQVEPLKQF